VPLAPFFSAETVTHTGKALKPFILALLVKLICNLHTRQLILHQSDLENLFI
jgi:hypothetical protein